MSLTRLQDDLLHDFQEQKKFIHDQIELFDPLAKSLQKPAATRLVSKGALIICEILCYLLCLGTIALAVLLTKVYPFSVLGDIMYHTQTRLAIGLENLFLFQVAIYSMAALIALLFYIIARVMRAIRLKNDILHEAGKDMKALVGQLLRRRAVIETIEQRHFMELPTLETRNGVNDIPNPGYDGPAL